MSMRSYSDHFWTRFPKINNKKGATVDLWGGAVDKQYQNKKQIQIHFKTAIDLAMDLARQKGYTHAFVYATNVRSRAIT